MLLHAQTGTQSTKHTWVLLMNEPPIACSAFVNKTPAQCVVMLMQTLVLSTLPRLVLFTASPLDGH